MATTFSRGDTIALRWPPSLSPPPDSVIWQLPDDTWRTVAFGDSLCLATNTLPLGEHVVAATAHWAARAPQTASCTFTLLDRQAPLPIPFLVTATYSHDPTAYTQGLLACGDTLYESTGQYGRSGLRQVHLATGQVQAETPLPRRHFGEGLARVRDQLWQLTWKKGVGMIYDRRTLAQVGQFTYAGEGWGLAARGDTVIMSDGSATLRWLDPDSGTVVRSQTIYDHQGPVDGLNELEFVGDELWANRYPTDLVLRIDLRSNRVTGVLDLQPLRPGGQRTGVANGLAYDPARRHLYVTGKYWPVLYVLELN